MYMYSAETNFVTSHVRMTICTSHLLGNLDTWSGFEAAKPASWHE